MSQISYARANAPRPTLNSAERDNDPAVRPRGRHAAYLPLIISLGVQWMFFLQYWLPETSGVPARDWWLTQLAPLASPLLTSGGEPQVAAQQGQLHVGPVILLAASFVLFWLSRTPQWWGRMVMVVPAGVGLIAALGILVQLAATSTMSQSGVGVTADSDLADCRGARRARRLAEPLGHQPAQRLAQWPRPAHRVRGARPVPDRGRPGAVRS